MAILFLAGAACLLAFLQSGASEDRRVEQRKGYHIITRPARTGETPADVKQEKADEDTRRKRGNQDLTDQTPPTRQPELKPKQIQP